MDNLGPAGEEVPATAPLTRFQRWHAEATAAGVPYPDAMVLATVDEGGAPDARTVLLAGAGETGLRFFSDRRSAKAGQLALHPYAAVVFGWYVAGRQVRAVGPVSPLPRSAAVAHFAGLDRDGQLAVHACRQSQVVAERAILELAYQRFRDRWPEGEPVPAPEHWAGWLIRPDRWEFWQRGPDHLNDRIRYQREPDGWVTQRLAP